jgi:peptidoglycan/LPS O-acetylase OafA/YrhL
MTASPPPPRETHPLPTGIARDARYFFELECLRGVAIALVVLFHADGLVRFPFRNTKGMWPPLPLALVFGGHTGVSLFFVLSGFLLALPFLAEADGERRVDRRVYYRKRALRILPIYWAVLALGVVVTVRSVADLLPSLGHFDFLNSVPSLIRPMRPFTDVTWSLATEVQFYAVLPLVALCLRTRLRLALLLALFSLAYLTVVIGPFGGPPPR